MFEIFRNGGIEPADLLAKEVESVLVDAAPDLDDIVVEIDEGQGEPTVSALAGRGEEGRRIEA